MITTVCLNPSIDKTVDVSSIEVGEVNRILNMLQFVSVNFYGERFIEQKWRIKDGKIRLIIHYQSNGITKGKMALVYYHE